MCPRATDEGCGGMTEMAIQRSRNVRAMFADRRYPVAGRAIVHDAGMIKHRPDERTGVMTDTAILVGCYVADRFTNGEHVIVT